MTTLVQGGKIVTSTGIVDEDILIENGVICDIGQNLGQQATEIIPAENRLIFPGGVDIHTHMDLDAGIARAVDDFYTGTVAAICGGTTTIVDHPAFGPAGCTLHHQIKEYHQLANNRAVTDYSFHGVVQDVNTSLLTEMEALFQEGITSFKGYLTYDYRLNDAQIYQLLMKMDALGGIAAFHAENHDIITYLRKKYVEEGKTGPEYHPLSRPADLEAEAVSRLLKIAHLCNDAPLYIVHLSTKMGLEEVIRARKRGQQNIYVETCPQYLLLSDEKYQCEDALKYIMSPPLRKKEDKEQLWQGLSNGDIQVVATDHCPFRYQVEKQLGKKDFTACPNGLPGVEERMLLLYSEGVAKERITPEQYVKLTSENPAKLAGLYPQKGAIQKGADADLMILNPENEFSFTEHNIHGAADYTAYEELTLQGEIDRVMLRGQVVVQNHEFIGQKGQGKFLKRHQRTDII